MRTNNLVKTVGEGDWGKEGDLGNPDAQTQPAYTDWLVDFTGTGPPIVSSGPEDDDGTRLDHPDSGPQPGPSTRPTSTRDLPTGLQPAGGKVMSQKHYCTQKEKCYTTFGVPGSK